MSDRKTLFTIGYAPHSPEEFVALLKSNRIDVVADVRSSPYSQFKPEFNRESLATLLKSSNIGYVFLGEQLGARIRDTGCYRNGRVVFDLAAKTELFREGLQRVRNGLGKYRIALMCAEKDPLTCHRSILVSKNAVAEGIEVTHILADGTLEEHHESEKRLLKLHKLHHPALFETAKQLLERAYSRQEEKVAYSEDSDPGEQENTPEESLL